MQQLNGLHISRQESRRAFVLNVVNGMFFSFAETLMDPTLVLVWFVSRLTTSNLLLGLILPISSGGWFFPQLFLSGKVQQSTRKMPLYQVISVARFFTWLALAAALWWISAPAALLVLFYLLFLASRVAAGAAGIPFMEVTVKTIPMRARGQLFGMRLLFGGLLGLLGTRIVERVLLSELPYPRNYALLILIGAVAGGVAMAAFCFTREPEGTRRAGAPLREQLRRGVMAFRNDTDYRYLLLGRSCAALGTSVLPFYTLLTQRVLAAPESAVGNFLAVLTFGKLLSNYPLGWLADHKGRRWVLRLATLGWVATALFSLGILALARAGLLTRFAFPGYWLAYPLFVLVALFSPADWVAGQNLLLDLAPEDDRPLYLGFANTVLGLALLSSGLAGGLVDWLGLSALFAAAVVVNLLAWYFLGRLAPQPAIT